MSSLGQVAHQARAYPSFRPQHNKQLGIFLLPLDEMLVYTAELLPSIKFASTWVERSTVRVKFIA